jgi:hypothetical protein
MNTHFLAHHVIVSSHRQLANQQYAGKVSIRGVGVPLSNNVQMSRGCCGEEAKNSRPFACTQPCFQPELDTFGSLCDPEAGGRMSDRGSSEKERETERESI